MSLKMNVLVLPVEIHEKILSYLDIRDLMSAIRTCQLWQTIGSSRHLKHWCQRHISSDVVSELIHEVDLSDKDIHWGKLCKKWSMAVDPSADSNVKPIEIMVKSTCIAVSGDVVLVGDVSKNLAWFDLRGNEIVKKSFGEKITSIGLLSLANHGDTFKMNPLGPDISCLQHDAVITLGPTFVGIYSMPTWQIQELYFLHKLHIAVGVSVQGRRFSYYTTARNVIRVCTIAVLRAASQPSCRLQSNAEWKIEVETLCKIYATAHVQNWKLWEKSLACLQTDGTVLIADVDTGQKSYLSNVMSEMLYPFESFLHRRLIFCNINVARAMLNFWHINMGLPHWLVSTDGTTFRRMSTYLESGEELKSIAIRRTAIVAGTSSGRICIYRHTGSDVDIPETILKGPMAIYHVCQDQIYNCDFSLDGRYLLIVVETRQNLVYILKLNVIENYTIYKF